jgi:hypothetical protein
MSAPRGASHDRALRRRLPRGAAVLLLAASGFAAPAAAQTVDTGTIDTVTLDYTTLD